MLAKSMDPSTHGFCFGNDRTVAIEMISLASVAVMFVTTSVNSLMLSELSFQFT